MVPAPLRPAQTFLIVIASFLTAGALWPGNAQHRLVCAGGAGAIMVGVLLARLREHRAPSVIEPATPSAAQRLRAERDARMHRRR